ncbi:MAG: hypothetical protein KKG10_01795, partial [Proteobacteria bacterium]|nr:hypothetical protein [Pseudomonadota bacterium]
SDLALADFRVRDKLGLAVGTLFHPGPPLKKRIYTNQTNQRTKMNEDKLKGKNHRFLFLSELHELQGTIFESGRGRRIKREENYTENNKGIKRQESNTHNITRLRT